MRLAYKILIGLGITFVVLFGIPTTYAVATGKSEALKGLIQTLKYILEAHKVTLKAIIEAYKEYLGAI